MSSAAPRGWEAPVKARSGPTARAVEDQGMLCSGSHLMNRLIVKGLAAVSVALVLFAAAPAVAQTSVAGDWDVTIVSPQGPNTVRVTFKQEGEKISGIFKSQMGELPFENGS